jgi:hypothetical protein
LSSFDLSNLALDRIVWNKTETDENTRCPMGDWTSQNWTKRDGRNNHQQQQQEKKATYKTAAELAVKNQLRKLSWQKRLYL